MPHIASAWRARRALLIGDGDDLTQLLCAHLTALGARPVSVSADASAEALYRALTDGRVAAVIACVPLTEAALKTLKTELRETGVPYALLCPAKAQDAQETALRALAFLARLFEEALPSGVYNLSEITCEPACGPCP